MLIRIFKFTLCNPLAQFVMFWTFIFLFLTIVTAIMGFLGIGYGVIEGAQVLFYIFSPLLVVSYLMEVRKKRRRYYD